MYICIIMCKQGRCGTGIYEGVIQRIGYSQLPISAGFTPLYPTPLPYMHVPMLTRLDSSLLSIHTSVRDSHAPILTRVRF